MTYKYKTDNLWLLNELEKKKKLSEGNMRERAVRAVLIFFKPVEKIDVQPWLFTFPLTLQNLLNVFKLFPFYFE